MRNTLAILLLVSCIDIGSQTFDWAKKYIKHENKGGTDVVHDAYGSAYVLGGWYKGNTHSTPYEGSFLAKYSVNGVKVWDQDLPSGNSKLTINGSQEIIVSGYDSTTYFIEKYDTNGTKLSHLALFSTQQGVIRDITSDSNNNLYIVGMFWDTLNILSQTIIKEFSSNLFIIKINPNNIINWSQTSTAGNFTDRACLDVDPSGNCYIGGQFTGTFSMGGETLNSNIYDGYIVKLNSNGVFQWKKGFSGDGQEYITDLSVSANGELYAIGFYDTQLSIGSSTLSCSSTPYPDGFLVKLNSSGNMIWIKQLASSGIDLIKGVKVNSTHNVYIAGSYVKTGGVSSFSISNTVISSNSNVISEPIIAKIDSSGALQWLLNTGTHSYSYGSAHALTINSNNRVFVTGVIDSVMSFGSELKTEYPTMFLTRISDSESTGLRPLGNELVNEIVIFPNPTENMVRARIHLKKSANVELGVYNMMGIKVLSRKVVLGTRVEEFVLPLDNLPTGSYLVNVYVDSKKVYSKVISRN